MFSFYIEVKNVNIKMYRLNWLLNSKVSLQTVQRTNKCTKTINRYINYHLSLTMNMMYNTSVITSDLYEK